MDIAERSATGLSALCNKNSYNMTAAIMGRTGNATSVPHTTSHCTAGASEGVSGTGEILDEPQIGTGEESKINITECWELNSMANFARHHPTTTFEFEILEDSESCSCAAMLSFVADVQRLRLQVHAVCVL